jgi:hypothetical protein
VDILAQASEMFNEAYSLLDRLQGVSSADSSVELCEEEWRKVTTDVNMSAQAAAVKTLTDVILFFVIVEQDVKSMIKLCIASKISIAALQKDSRIQELREFTINSQRKKAAATFQSAASTKSKSRKQTHVPLKDSLQEQQPKHDKILSEPISYMTPTRRVLLDWKYHPWWPTISLL